LRGVCDGIVKVASAEAPALPSGTYNVGSGQPSTVRGLAELVAGVFEAETGRRPDLDAPEPEPNPPAEYRVSVERAADHGLRFDAPLADAVTETVRFCLEHREELR